MNGNLTPSDSDEPVLDARRRRILFRATHRGMQETDRLVGGFVAAHIRTFDEGELDAIERVIALIDADLADWLLGRSAVPPEHDTPMLRAMLGHANRKIP